MAREFRWLSALHPLFPLAPEPLLLCEDPAIVGSVFYVMERRRGLLIRHEEPAVIASNLMRRHWRAERRRLAAYARAAVHEIPGVDPEVAEEAILAVARLPRRQREVVLLHVWADLSYEQIARALDIPVGTSARA